MKNRLIMIEGIPGSGKTTCARNLEAYLKEEGINVRLFTEGDVHPVDMAWQAYLSKEEYKNLLKQYPEHESSIRAWTKVNENDVTIAYTKLDFNPNQNELMNFLEAHEVYDGRVSLETFEKLHLKRWGSFMLPKEQVAIFECAYLQNNIGELMGIYAKPKRYIYDYLERLIMQVEHLNPLLIYLTQPSVEETIGRVAKERKSPDKSRWEDWIDIVIRFVEDSAYGKKYQLRGVEGMIEFYKRRRALELEVIEKLPIKCIKLENPNYDWDTLNKQIRALIDNRINR